MPALRPKPTMRERILETADRLFYLQGIRAVGVDTIAAEIGISKRTLYNHFASKDELIAAYLTRRARPIPASDEAPAAQILATFDVLERRFGRDDFRGCPFVNAVAELGSADHAARKIAFDFKETRRVWFRGLLRQLGIPGADDLAMQLAILLDGAIAANLVRNDPAVARSAKTAAMALLRQAEVDLGAASAGKAAPARRRRGKST
jgi:AcrR family transcriptional regulator